MITAEQIIALDHEYEETEKKLEEIRNTLTKLIRSVEGEEADKIAEYYSINE